jgi:hypothetical protein
MILSLQTLRDRLDETEVPNLDIDTPESPVPPKDKTIDHVEPAIDKTIDKNVFECRIEKLVQKSVHHIFNNNKKKVFAKTVFIKDEKSLYDAVDVNVGELKGIEEGGVLNLSVKNDGRRKSHGRKQSAPRRIAYVDYDGKFNQW